MRREELLKLPELKVTETMRKTVRKDQGHQVLRCGRAPIWSATYYWFYRAKKTGTVLEIDVFTRDMILDGTAHPKYRVFLLEENKYYTYDNLCEKWRTAKIDNLSYMEGWGEIQQGYWYSSRKVWIREEDQKRISEFCHNGKKEPRAAIARWQNYSKGRKEIDEIDSEMALVPELMPDAPVMNLPEEEKQVHEITEEVVQEGEVIEDILKSGDPEKIIQLLKKEFAWPKGGWDNWKKKVITL